MSSGPEQQQQFHFSQPIVTLNPSIIQPSFFRSVWTSSDAETLRGRFICFGHRRDERHRGDWLWIAHHLATSMNLTQPCLISFSFGPCIYITCVQCFSLIDRFFVLWKHKLFVIAYETAMFSVWRSCISSLLVPTYSVFRHDHAFAVMVTSWDDRAVEVEVPINIALVKYWGKRDEVMRCFIEGKKYSPFHTFS